MLLKVDLNRRACAFEHDDVMVAGETPVRFDHRRVQRLHAPLMIIRCRNLAPYSPADDHLCRRIGGRLDENRIHVHTRRHACGIGLHGLRPSDLETFWRGGRIE